MSKITWLALLLIVSVALNLLLIGVGVGRHLARPPERPHFDWMMQGVNTATRARLHRSAREYFRDTRPNRRALREAQRALHRAIVADPYSEEDVARAFAGVREASAELQETLHRQTLDALGKMEREERMRVLRAISRWPPGRLEAKDPGPES